MKRYLILLVLSFGLAACNDDHKDQENTGNSVELAPSLAKGTYSVSVETNDELPMVGKYFSGADGNKLLILNDEQDRAQVVMSYDVKSRTWQANQNNFKPISFAHVDQLTDQTVDVASLAGSYILSFPNDQQIAFELNSNGTMLSKGSNCSFAGTVTASQINNVLNYQLQNNNCELLKNNTKGYLVVDDDLNPASFRLVSSIAGSQDGWAFSSES